MFTDTHCHLLSEYYDDIEQVINNAKDNKVNKYINNGCNDSSNHEVVDLCKKYSNIYGAVGIHPEDIDTFKDSDLDYIREQLVNNDKIVALGEIGLDYYWVKDNKEEQIKLFRRQLDLAQELNVPVIIHSRDATGDMIEILTEYKLCGVIHGFSGSLEVANIFIKMGFKLGINGVITFKNCNLKDVISKIDLSNIVLETDSPYLTPVPYRGEQNNPSHVLDVAKYICELKGISIDELSLITEKNVKDIYGIGE